MPIVNWKATERCITTPIPSSHQSLANVKFRLDPNESPTVDDVRHIEGPQDWDRFTPELFVDIDVARLLSDTRLAPDNIAISVIVRDRDLGRFERVQEWGLDSLPEDAWSLNPALERFSRSVRLDVTIVATPRAPVIDGTSSPMPPGTLLAVKTFRIRAPSPGLDFPFKFVQPEKMAEQPGLHRATVCYRTLGRRRPTPRAVRPDRGVAEQGLRRQVSCIERPPYRRSRGSHRSQHRGSSMGRRVDEGPRTRIRRRQRRARKPRLSCRRFGHTGARIDARRPAFDLPPAPWPITTTAVVLETGASRSGFWQSEAIAKP